MKRMLLGPVLVERLLEFDWLAVGCGTSLENAGGIVATSGRIDW